MTVVGITGRSGAGKSTVAQIFAEHGAYIINADKIARELVLPGSECLEKIVCKFGQDILKKDGSLDRRALGAIVFSNGDNLSCLNEIMFPAITVVIEKIINILRAQSTSLVLLDAPQLFEAGADKLCDTTIGIITADEALLQRICKRDGVDVTAAKNRLKSAHSNDFFVAECDFVIRNDGDLSKLTADIERIINKLESNIETI